jgi:CheY-like chemotaxis protein
LSKIAVVEDNPDSRLLARVILERDYSVAEYETGKAALEGFGSERPDLILLDISLPGMDGLEVLKRIRADPALESIPVIALTAHAMATDREQFLAAGFDEYVAKPITSEVELLGKIERLMRR